MTKRETIDEILRLNRLMTRYKNSDEDFKFYLVQLKELLAEHDTAVMREEQVRQDRRTERRKKRFEEKLAGIYRH